MKRRINRGAENNLTGQFSTPLQKVQYDLTHKYMIIFNPILESLFIIASYLKSDKLFCNGKAYFMR